VARRTIRVIDIVELYQHWHAGRRIGELSSSLGVDPKTIRKYSAPALAAGIVPGGPVVTVAKVLQLGSRHDLPSGTSGARPGRARASAGSTTSRDNALLCLATSHGHVMVANSVTTSCASPTSSRAECGLTK
jgi:hypothetical protein